METCSRIAVHSALKPQPVTDEVNFRRIAELWLDDFKDVVYRQGAISPTVPDYEAQSIQERQSYLRKHLPNCKSFGWYLNNIATAVFAPSDAMASFGKLRVKTGYCLWSTAMDGEVSMALCRQHMYERDSIFEMNRDGFIFKGDQCLQLDDNDRAELRPCEDDNPNQKWRLFERRLSPITVPSKCLSQMTERDPNTMDLFHYAQLKVCNDEDSRKQKWDFINYWTLDSHLEYRTVYYFELVNNILWIRKMWNNLFTLQISQLYI